MPAVTAPMTGRTVGATTSFAVRNQTSGAGGKPVLPVFARAGLRHKRKKHRTEWFNRNVLRLVEYDDDRPPLGLEPEPRIGRRPGDAAARFARAGDLKAQRAMQKAKLPWPGVKQPQPSGRVINLGNAPIDSAQKIRKIRSTLGNK